MAVWTPGSARRKNAFWSWLAWLLPRRGRPAPLQIEGMPDALRRDVAAPEGPLPRPEDDLWARIAAAKLPRL